jgi:DNA-directed RNA polymerase subunit alpha
MPTMADTRILPRITHEDVNETEGVFTVEPLDRGYGYTFGNSLRRVLLSSLEGAAVTQVKIEGALHEFTTVAGVREDVIDLILNLKGLVCRIHGDDELKEVEADIVKEGPGKVYARDIAAPSDLEIINPDLYICELQDGARLEMTLTIAKGRGYVPAEGNKSHESTIGVIPVDAIFSPVRRVTYHVDAARVGQRTDYDKLTIDVKTNGSVDPRKALEQAAKILIEQLNIFANLDPEELQAGMTRAAGAVEAEVPQAHGMENILIEELELGVRSYNCLKRVGIETIGDLVSKTEQELAAIPNFGKKSIEEVKATLATHNLYLRGDEP